MSVYKNMRPEDRFAVPHAAPTKQPKPASKKIIDNALQQMKYTQTIDELGGLKLFGRTKAELAEKVEKALQSGCKRGTLFVTSEATEFKKMRDRAERKAKRRAMKTQPLKGPQIGTTVYQWTTTGLSFYKAGPNGVRHATVPVICSCGFQREYRWSDLNAGRSTQCEKCSRAKAKARTSSYRENGRVIEKLEAGKP